MPAVTQERFIEMQVRDVRKAPDTPPDCYVVLLQERDGDRRLGIWIGREQALGLALRLERAELGRPGTYDMTANAIRALGGRLREVRIDRLSDALNLALVSEAPIRADRVMVDQILAAEAGARATLKLW